MNVTAGCRSCGGYRDDARNVNTAVEPPGRANDRAIEGCSGNAVKL
jgi:hypothetical protein